jgi:hypothetical protein
LADRPGEKKMNTKEIMMASKELAKAEKRTKKLSETREAKVTAIRAKGEEKTEKAVEKYRLAVLLKEDAANNRVKVAREKLQMLVSQG